ncbi:hypothetical protein [Amnibacterium kyonggiense]|uniref:Uncharacterized protein n=1 Tax=Amnibacterium kyonggiense TaxID=595671 RepID=A0A4R7FPA5_9MICO|nr:hypothetical protein [Amnibacterium kyonggiense]TDS79523.1 hypothetical protein CLV52_0052 [Amnibacterium kyonggiense]
MTSEFEQFDQTLEPLRAEAGTVQSSLAAARRQIDSDPTLSDEGRREKFSTLRDNAQARLDQLKAAEVKRIQDKITSLERSLFGYTTKTDPNEIISRRDADDRADRLESADDAAALLERAERAGDTHLAQAIVRVAASKGYANVVKAYEDAHPGAGGKISLLSQIQQSTSQANYLMGRTYAYSARGI